MIDFWMVEAEAEAVVALAEREAVQAWLREHVGPWATSGAVRLADESEDDNG